MSDERYQLTIDGLTREQAKTLYASMIGVSYPDLLDSGNTWSGLLRAHGSTDRPVVVKIGPA